jgi:hypothetical protein
LENPTKFSLKFEQIYLSKPTHWEKDGAPTPMMPNEVEEADIFLLNLSQYFSGTTSQSYLFIAALCRYYKNDYTRWRATERNEIRKDFYR